MVIHDDQVGFAGPLLHRRKETLVEVRALLSRARVASRIDPRPQIGIVRKKRQLRAIARSVSFAQSRICRNASISSMPFSIGWSAI